MAQYYNSLEYQEKWELNKTAIQFYDTQTGNEEKRAHKHGEYLMTGYQNYSTHEHKFMKQLEMDLQKFLQVKRPVPPAFALGS